MKSWSRCETLQTQPFETWRKCS